MYAMKEVVNPLNGSVKTTASNDNSVKISEKYNLKEKIFIPRNSLLTDLWESSTHCRSLHFMLIAGFIHLCLNVIMFNCLDPDPYLAYGLFTWSFGKFHIVLVIWTAMLLVSMVIPYFGFMAWTLHRQHSQEYGYRWWVLLYLIYLVLFFYFPAYFVMKIELPPASSITIAMEQVRLVFKSHAFIRCNCEKAIAGQFKTSCGKAYPKFFKYFYFLFAPTLIYRDEYPRNSSVRWTYVLSNLSQMAAVIFLAYFVAARLCFPTFSKFGQEPITSQSLVLSVFGSVLPGIITLLCFFFGLLHFFCNALAEISAFADRLFYKDWWNSTDVSGYLRTWNIVIHDWLYTYVYRDMFKVTNSPFFSKMAVFVVSTVLHEYITLLTFKFLLPSIFVLYWLSVPFTFITSKARYWNACLMFGLMFGVCIIVNLYCMEWYLRENCGPYYETGMDKFIPRLWNYDICHKKLE